MCRWYVYRRTEWTSWISSRDALWSNTCPLHLDYKGTRCYGKNFLHQWKLYDVIAIIIGSYLVFSVREVQKCWVWEMSKSLLLWTTMPPCWSVRHSSPKQGEYILSSMWRCVYTSVKISWEYPFCSAVLFPNATIDILSAFYHLALLLSSEMCKTRNLTSVIWKQMKDNMNVVGLACLTYHEKIE